MTKNNNQSQDQNNKKENRAWMWVGGGSFLALHQLYRLAMNEVSLGWNVDFFLAIVLAMVGIAALVHGCKKLNITIMDLVAGRAS